MKLLHFFLCSTAILFLLLTFPGITNAQAGLNTDSLMQVAQQLVVQKKYENARKQARKVLEQAPEYTDAALLIGRTYAWEKNYDSARVVLVPLLQTASSKEEVLLVLSSVELWAGEAKSSLLYAEQGLSVAPGSPDLALAKVLALRDLQKYKEATAFIHTALKNTPTDERLLDLQNQLADLSRSNQLGISFQLTSFDQDISNWQLGTIQYTRKTAKATFAGKINYAERFGKKALQAELEAWPRLNEKTYAYLSVGASDSEIFPAYRAGAELYRILPHQMEASLGLRTLAFEQETVLLYTGHFGVYFHKYWAAFRPFVQFQHSNWQATGILQVRRYFRHSDEFVSLSLSKGSTPSEQVALQEIKRLDASRIGLEGQIRLGSRYLLGGLMQYEKEEYAENSTRNRFTSGLSFHYKF
ncbi:YaiO family outer membrane beta-barrel protein [Pontibacter locisalis]|uniref:YaiO family outer membrane beta-barrel protein n=1 Tax=Pontibacter locisalis TaxID=1719035 RepID=A0ABW5IP38_9BACT